MFTGVNRFRMQEFLFRLSQNWEKHVNKKENYAGLYEDIEEIKKHQGNQGSKKELLDALKRLEKRVSEEIPDIEKERPGLLNEILELIRGISKEMGVNLSHDELKEKEEAHELKLQAAPDIEQAEEDLTDYLIDEHLNKIRELEDKYEQLKAEHEGTAQQSDDSAQLKDQDGQKESQNAQPGTPPSSGDATQEETQKAVDQSQGQAQNPQPQQDMQGNEDLQHQQTTNQKAPSQNFGMSNQSTQKQQQAQPPGQATPQPPETQQKVQQNNQNLNNITGRHDQDQKRTPSAQQKPPMQEQQHSQGTKNGPFTPPSTMPPHNEVRAAPTTPKQEKQGNQPDDNEDHPMAPHPGDPPPFMPDQPHQEGTTQRPVQSTPQNDDQLPYHPDLGQKRMQKTQDNTQNKSMNQEKGKKEKASKNADSALFTPPTNP